MPELYIEWDYSINASVNGVENPILVLTSGATELLKDLELLWLIGHEMRHIKSGHVLFHTMAEMLPLIGGVVGGATLGIGTLISSGMQIPLLNWYRKSEFTADRAGLLACQDVSIAASALVKMAGLPTKYHDRIDVEDFLKQAREFESFDLETLNKLIRALSVMSLTHPWTVMRAAELQKWYESGSYDKVLNRQRQTKASNGPSRPQPKCSRCNQSVASAWEYCTNCGAEITCIAVPARKCPGCGNVIQSAWRYCIHCGAALAVNRAD